jgi:hypothetical protein
MAMERVWRVFKEEAKLGKLVYDGALKLLVLLHGVDCVYPLLCLFPVFEWLLPDGMFFFACVLGWMRWRCFFHHCYFISAVCEWRC